MIDADDFLGPAKARGFDFYAGVPCSFLTPIINRVISDPAIQYVGAASEGEAVAIAAGAWLAGRNSAVMFQNSGLGNAVNPLTSLNQPFLIPALVITTWRGGPGIKDEPQHDLMGKITQSLFDVMGIRHKPFPKDKAAVDGALDEATAAMAETGLPFAFVMEKGDVADAKLTAQGTGTRPKGARIGGTSGVPRHTRWAALEALLKTLPDSAAVIATTGKCGRELFTLADRRQHLYQVGSMGCAAGMGLGVALCVDRPVVVIDGDGAALMKLGTLATVGAYAPKNLVHVVLDNAVHDSTGGQPTVSASVDFADVALACGYATGYSCSDADEFASQAAVALTTPGPHLIHMRIAPGSRENLGRPTVKPPEVARRFKEFLAGGR